MAEFVQQVIDGDLFEIETVQRYAAGYYECIEEVKAELRADACPEVRAYLEDEGLNIDDCDTPLLGYPN